MSASLICTAYSRKEVVMTASGLTADTVCSFYRRSQPAITPPPSGGWGTGETIVENVKADKNGNCVVHCYDAVSGHIYYCKTVIGSGNPTWLNSAGPVVTSNLAEELKDDYVPQSLNVTTTQEAVATIQNNSGSVNFSSVPVGGGKKIAVVVLQKNEIQGESYTDFSDSELAFIFYNASDKYNFQMIATSSTENISGKTPAISGYLKLKYNSTGEQ